MDPAAYSTLDEILSQFGQSPYGANGAALAAQRNALLQKALGTGAAAAPAGSLTAEEQALLAKAYPEPQPVEVPPEPSKGKSILAAIAEGLASGTGHHDIAAGIRDRRQQAALARQKALLHNLLAPEEARAARAKAELAIVSGRTSSAERKADQTARDAEYINQLRKDAAEIYGVEGAASMQIPDLLDAMQKKRNVLQAEDVARQARAEKRLQMAEDRDAAKAAREAQAAKDASQDKVADRQEAKDRRTALRQAKLAAEIEASKITSVEPGTKPGGTGGYLHLADRQGQLVSFDDLVADAKAHAVALGLDDDAVEEVVRYARQQFARAYVRSIGRGAPAAK